MVTNVSLSAGSDFIITSFTSGLLVPGASGTVSVQFAPHSSGARNALVQIWNNSGVNPVQVPVAGFGIGPMIVLSTTSLDFGTNRVGATSGALSVTVSNVGNAALVISSATIGGLNPGDFTIATDGCLSSPILPGLHCRIDLTFNTTVALDRTAVLTVTGNATDSPQTVALHGVGSAFVCPTITLSPTSLPPALSKVPYNQNITAVGGTTPFTTFEVTAGNLPEGLTLDSSSGNLFGRPTEVTSSTFTITGTDGNGCSGSRAYTIPVSCPVLTVSPATLSNATQGVFYSQKFATLLPTGDPVSSTLSFSNNVSLAITNEIGRGLIGVNDSALDVSGIGSQVTNVTVALYLSDACTSNTVAPTIKLIGPDGTTVILSAAHSGVYGTDCAGRTIFDDSAATAISAGTVPFVGAFRPDAALAAFVGKRGPQANGRWHLQVGGAACDSSFLYCWSLTISGPEASYSGTAPVGMTLNSDGLLSGNPTVPGTNRFAVVTTDASGCAGSNDYQLVVIPAGPIIGFVPDLLGTFGDVAVGASSNQSVLVTNAGTAALVITNLALAGNNPADFQLTPTSSCLGVPVPPGGTCVINVQFAPQTGGNLGATVLVYDNSAGSPHSFPVKGAGIAPVIVPVPTSIDFGTQTVNVATAPQWVQIYNTGNGPLLITNVTLVSTNAPDFAIVADSCLGSPIAPGSSCSLGLTFKPGAALPRTGTLIIDNNGTNGQQRIHLTGVGADTAPALAYSPTSLIFSDTTLGTTSAVQSVTVSNAGTAALVIGGIKFSGANANEFVVQNSTCTGLAIAPGGSCTIPVAFVPAGSAARFANLQVLSNAGNGTNLVPVEGSGVAPALALSTTSLDFGTNMVGTISAPQSVLISNTGNAALVINSVMLGGLNPGDFAIVADPCLGSTILPGNICQVSLNFATTAMLPRSAVLTITANSLPPQTVTLQGVGKQFSCSVLALAPSSLPSAQPGVPYSQTLTPGGGTAPYQFVITSGALPAGLALNAATGTISGQTSAVGTYNFTIAVSDVHGCSGSAAYSLVSQIIVFTPPTIMTASELPDAIVGVPYHQTLTATGGTPPYTWTLSASSAMPLGLGLSGSTISGTPLTQGQYTFMISCAGSNGLASQRAFFVTAKQMVATPTITPAGGTFTNSGLVKLSCATTGATIRYTLDGSVPTSSSAAYKKTGILLTNSATLKAKAFKTNLADGALATATFTVIVPEPISIATIRLADATAKQAYSVTLQVTPGTGVAPFKWSIVPGGDKLPAGLTLNATRGVIAGKPAKATALPVNFTVKVTDARKQTATQLLTLTVN